MSLYPKWLLLLAAICILPAVLSPFYIFVFPSELTFFGVVGYIMKQLLWFFPAYSAYKGLDYYYREFERLGIGVTAFGAVVAIGGGLWTFLG